MKRYGSSSAGRCCSTSPLFGVGCLAAEILIPYHPLFQILEDAHAGVVCLRRDCIHHPDSVGRKSLAATFLPRLKWDRDYTLMLVAIFGTTISPYMFFWQASLEAEERKLRGKAKRRTRLPRTAKRLAQGEEFRMGLDTASGMILSNVIGFFIIITTAATLHAHGVTQIDTAAQAAEALRPLAGPLAFFLFALGIIGTGLLAVPVLAGSAGYAVAESFGWESSLELPARGAPGFYLIVAASTLAGLGAALTPLDPIRMLFWSAVVNGIVAVPLMVAMMLVVANRKIMGKFAASRALMIGGWAATALMAVVVAAMLITSGRRASGLHDPGRRARLCRVRGAMRPRQIGLRAHFDQARRGALEFLRLEAFIRPIERVGLGRGRGDELHVHVVERVDQDDEALGGIALVESHHRDVVENDGVIFVRDAQIVGGASGCSQRSWKVKRATPMEARGTCTLRPCSARSCGAPRCPPASRRQASSSAASAAASAGTYHTGMPASFSRRKSVRASSRTTSMHSSSIWMNGTNSARFNPSL